MQYAFAREYHKDASKTEGGLLFRGPASILSAFIQVQFTCIYFTNPFHYEISIVRTVVMTFLSTHNRSTTVVLPQPKHPSNQPNTKSMEQGPCSEASQHEKKIPGR
jgi:hypothetical protein